MIPFWKKAFLIACIVFGVMGALFFASDAPFNCETLRNTTDWERLCGHAPPSALEIVFIIACVIVIIAMIWGAVVFRKRMRELGEILAKQSEQKEWGPPDPGNPHEDTKANRDEDPR